MAGRDSPPIWAPGSALVTTGPASPLTSEPGLVSGTTTGPDCLPTWEEGSTSTRELPQEETVDQSPIRPAGQSTNSVPPPNRVSQPARTSRGTAARGSESSCPSRHVGMWLFQGENKMSDELI